jgi:predicted ATPase/DNA-binding winged helix-turn-helix (wHTH) protein
MTPASPTDPLLIGRAVVDPRARRVTVEGRPVRLSGRAFDILMLLVAERERVVGKDEILAAVWPRQVVEENNLQVQIAALRRALGKEAIVTVSGRGYGLAVPVLPAEQAGGAAGGGASAARAADKLPLKPWLGNLPAAGPCIGRAVELAQCEQALGSGARLLSLAGPGGIGKTRLALELARRQAPHFADGVWFVELASLREADDLLHAVARTLRLGAQAASSATALAQSLGARSMLVVLDNCEHLLPPATLLAAAVLAEAPNVSLVLTTQEPLRLAGEQRFALGGLSLPAAPSLEAARASDAVALFVQRARAAAPNFALDADTAEPVSEICQRLDGVALAIEMAAARVPLLGVLGVRDRLGERLRLLARGPGPAPARQQTMRAALEWSLALLDTPERRLFRWLSVFVGGFTAAAVRALHQAMDPAGGRDDDWALLDRLGRLVDKSLVVSDGAATPRFRLLETVRSIAVEEAKAAEEWPALGRAHAAWARAHFERADADHVELANEHWLARYGPEMDNLREALRYTTSGPGRDPPTAVALAGSSAPCWFIAGLETEALKHMRATRPFVDGLPDPALAARWWAGLTTLALRRTLPVAEAIEACERALALYAALGDRRGQYKLWCVRAYLHASAGDAEAAGAAIARALEVEDPQWPPIVLVNRMQAESALYTMSGALERYLEAERRAARLYAAAGKPGSELVALSNVADAQLALGDARSALATVREVIERRRALGLQPTAAAAHVLLAALIELAELAPARRAAAQAVPLARGSGTLGELLDHLALLLAHEGRLHDAARVAGRADRSLAERGFPRQPAEARSRERVSALLEQALPGDELRALLEDGAAMSEEAAAALAGGSAAT